MVLVATVASATSGCGDNAESFAVPDGCQPLLAGQHCTLPYPSDYFRVEDASTETGYRIEMRGAGKLVSAQGESADLHARRVADGFSAIPTIVAVLPDQVSATGLAHLIGGIEDSVAADSCTLLLSEDGERVPHYVDLDPRADDPLRQAIVIHPAVGLLPRTRYVVAIRRVERPDGTAARAAEGFRRLREGDTDGVLGELQPHYDDAIFPLLEQAGWQRDEVQLAWDFTVGSQEAPVRDMLRVRELTLAWLEGNQPTVEITQVTDDPEIDVWRRIEGTVTGPLFLERDLAGADLARGGDGRVEQNGTTTFAFTVQIPTSVRDAVDPGRALAYGHGFFGSRKEIESTRARQMFETLGAVTFAIDWVGMSKDDLAPVLLDLSGVPADAIDFGDRVHQSVANWLVFGTVIGGALTDEDSLEREGGELVYGPEPLGFLGISQGHILGGAMAALNPAFDRIVLQVGGAGFTHMMFRARPFDSFLLIIQGVIDDPLDQQAFVATMQPSFDRFDPASYARFLLAEPPPGTPSDRRVLMQMGLGDVSVPNLGTLLHARLLGLPVTSPSPAALFGLDTVAPPTDEPALSIWDYGLDVAAIYADATPPAEENEVHEGVRVEATALAQLAEFLTSGTIVHPCDGPCDPD